MKIEELLKNKREKIIAIAAKHGANNVRIFGFVARGEADEKSDIDLLIDYCSERRSSWFPLPLIRELEALLGGKVDIVTEQGLKDRIRERVLKEAIPLGEMIPNACRIF
ncbi:Similar to tr/Q7NFK1/Q7NFK1 [Microcystis aeruginosa PCC 9432]|uniref:Similar to tr/Q7NFK1/Q7NFK1 n=1 Tax=Microcystis aeruginosa PCC 9432 TaxID=1160280 RepID=A0A822L955_MICAE|nr:nucleotidyltransferase family protein [Microcystis aeruginosa]TRU01673.1 MAG: DNA polymerase subunit beta [Microcystis aeruginosa Ma_OC_LR_19540900_S633]CCH92739.1 Similar to tr/Q7NFK1/Q7NFK1 [Microcystis aeruginosa PCC 9432]